MLIELLLGAGHFLCLLKTLLTSYPIGNKNDQKKIFEVEHSGSDQDDFRKTFTKQKGLMDWRKKCFLYLFVFFLFVLCLK